MSKPLESRRGQGRLAAMRFLYEWSLNSSEDLQEAMTLQFTYLKVKTGIAGYARQLIEGTLAHKEQIDRVISENLTNWNLDRVAVVERSILSLAVYEMLYMQEVPSKVTINEMVEIAKDYGSADSSSFVNGVLDGIRKKLEPDCDETGEEASDESDDEDIDESDDEAYDETDDEDRDEVDDEVGGQISDESNDEDD